MKIDRELLERLVEQFAIESDGTYTTLYDTTAVWRAQVTEELSDVIIAITDLLEE